MNPHPFARSPCPANLPFNAALIQGLFQAGVPDIDDPALPDYWVVLRGDGLVVRLVDGAPALPELGATPPVALREPGLRIGLWRGLPLRAGRALVAPAARESLAEPLPEPLTVVPLHFREKQLDDQLLTLAGLARQILHWRARSAACPALGVPTERISRTWGARCPACRGEYYPPIHPAVLVLVTRGEEILLARQAGWPSGQYSPVAGYVEFGESFEECACREVLEETGILVRDPRYVHSQSWPFPNQIMVGFTAEYAGGEIVVDASELEDARWFRAEAMPLVLPSKRSLSRYLIDSFLLGRG